METVSTKKNREDQKKEMLENLKENWREYHKWDDHKLLKSYLVDATEKKSSDAKSFHSYNMFSSPLINQEEACFKANMSYETELPLYRAFGGILPTFTDVSPSWNAPISIKDIEANLTMKFVFLNVLKSDFEYNVSLFRRLDLRYAPGDSLGQLTFMLKRKIGPYDSPPIFQPVQMGVIFYIQVEGHGLLHRIAVSLDIYGKQDLLQHTFFKFPSDSKANLVEAAIEMDGSAGIGMTYERSRTLSSTQHEDSNRTAVIQVMTYNVWHTQPAPWAVEHKKSKRKVWYKKRLKHLAGIVRESMPDIVGFQEVRYDASFFRSQARQLADLLPEYQFVYQPAMLQFDINRYWDWEDEGVAIFSRHPIIATDYILLSQDLNDPLDDHQRICLHAVVDVPNTGMVDVYVTHLSLSVTARERSVQEILEFASRGQGRAQFLLGDLNAEPHESAVRLLQNYEFADGHKFQDLWLQLHQEPKPNSTDPWERQYALTFPSCAPVKRIDYAFARAKTLQLDTLLCELRGQDPTAETKKENLPENIGMLDTESPIWASDHRSVFAQIRLEGNS